MGLPLNIAPNVTVNIYRLSNPAAPIPAGQPAVPNVQGYIKPYMPNGRYGSAQWLKWTHILIVPTGTDVRDAYNSQLDPARNNNQADTVVITDSNGNKVPYYVAYVEDAYRGTPMAQIRIYLDRFQPQTWPTDGI